MVPIKVCFFRKLYLLKRHWLSVTGSVPLSVRKCSKLKKMSDKYRRVKLMSYLWLSTKKDDDNEDDNEDEKEPKEQIVLYENKPFLIIVLIFSLLDVLKNCLLFYLPISLSNRFLYGDFIVSHRADHILFNLVMAVCCICTAIYCPSLLCGQQKAQFYRLSKFLYVLNPRQYSKQLLVSQQNAEEFSRWLDRGVLAKRLTLFNYLLFDLSFYAKTLYQAISLGFSCGQILFYTCPSILISVFAHLQFYRLAGQAFILFVLYIRVMNAKWSRLTDKLAKLNDGPASRRKLFKHLEELDSVICEYRVSRDFFQSSLVLDIPPLLITIILFPTNILYAENWFTNHIVLIFICNLFFVLIPIVKSNEKFKRHVALYRNSVHCFMARTKNTKFKLKLMKILDILQTSSSFSYTILGGLFDFEMAKIPIILCEAFSLSFLYFMLDSNQRTV